MTGSPVPGQILASGATTLSAWSAGSNCTLITGGAIHASSINSPGITLYTRRAKELRREYDLLLNAIGELAGEDFLGRVLALAADPAFRNCKHKKVRHPNKI